MNFRFHVIFFTIWYTSINVYFIFFLCEFWAALDTGKQHWNVAWSALPKQIYNDSFLRHVQFGSAQYNTAHTNDESRQQGHRIRKSTVLCCTSMSRSRPKPEILSDKEVMWRVNQKNRRLYSLLNWNFHFTCKVPPILVYSRFVILFAHTLLYIIGQYNLYEYSDVRFYFCKLCCKLHMYSISVYDFYSKKLTICSKNIFWGLIVKA
jgi:hypothetical protein